MTQNDLRTPYDSPEPEDKVTDAYPFSNEHEKASFLFEKILYKSVNLDDFFSSLSFKIWFCKNVS